MKMELLAALGIAINAVSIGLLTRRLNKNDEAIKAICQWNLEVMAKHNDLVDHYRGVEKTTHRLVQRVEVLTEQKAPATKEGRQWP